MTDLMLWWLIPIFFEVIGASIAVTVIGFTYEGTVRDAKPFFSVLRLNSRTLWLAVSGIIFAIGVGFSRVGWLSKGIAVALALGLIGFACYSLKPGLLSWRKNWRSHLAPKSIRIWIIKVWLSALVVLLMLWGIHLGWNAYHLYVLAKDLQKDGFPSQAQDLIVLVKSAAEDVSGIEEYLHPLFPVFNALQGIPGVGPYLGQVDPLLTYADGLARAGEQVVSGLEPLLVSGESEANSISLSERAYQVLEAGQLRFESAKQALEQAGAARMRINPGLLPNSLRSIFSLLDDRFDSMEAGVQFIQVAPGLLGSGTTQNYLVLAQNRDEERASGGFISGIGLVTLQAGKIEQFTLGDSYAVDDFTKPYPAPPEALKRFMLADYWVTRDGNWSPDFPTAARQVQSLYTLSTGIDTQGVVAFNQLAVKGILQAIGAVQVPGTDEPVTSENVEGYMRQAWAPGPEQGLSQEWWLHRKDFMQLLGNAILEKILASSESGQLLNLSKVLAELLDQGQLLVFFNDTTAQMALAQSGWDDALKPGSADYLFLVDSNVGFNKVDAVVQRSLDYQVDLSDMDHPTGKVTLTYQHTGIGNSACTQVASYGNGTYQDMLQRCYWDYWRVYTPAGSDLLSSSAEPVPSDELLNGEGWLGLVESLPGEANTQVFAGLMVLPIGNSAQFDILYSLPLFVLQPSGDAQESYSLRINVQPGLEGLPFSLEILLPPSFQVISASEGAEPASGNTWSWQGMLKTSTELSFILSTQPR
jgi:hypothetical protein